MTLSFMANALSRTLQFHLPQDRRYAGAVLRVARPRQHLLPINLGSGRRLTMRALRLSPIAFSLAGLLLTHAQAETIGDARVGFAAERVLILGARSYTGRMWHMPGEQRHEQDLQAIHPVFFLHADRALSEIVLPQLHPIVEFVLPIGLSVLSHPELSKAIGQASIEGIATTEYLVDQNSPEGHATGSLWLSRDEIPLRCVGKFVSRNGKVSTIDWQLHHVAIGKQDAALFEVPRHYAKLPLEAAAPLLGMRIALAPSGESHRRA